MWGKLAIGLFTFIAYAGHFTLLAFLPLLMVMPLIIVINKPSFIIPTAVVIAITSTFMLITDSIVFAIYHFHLNAALINLAFGEGRQLSRFFNLSTQENYIFLTIILSIALVEIVFAALIWKKIISKRRWYIETKISGVLFGCLFMSYTALLISITSKTNVLAMQTPNFPHYNEILASILPVKNSLSLIDRYSETRFSQPLFPVAPLHYPLHALNCKPHSKPYNIIIIGIDTWRFDTLNKTVTPNIEAFANTAWRFNNHISGGNATQPGLFSLFYALPSNYWSSMLAQKRGPLLIDELLKQGYQTQISFSADLRVPPFDDTIFHAIKKLRTDYAPGNTTPDRDSSITKEFTDAIMHRDKQKPFFGFVFYDSAHGYCGPQPVPKIFPTSSVDCSRIVTSKNIDSEDLSNRYKNALHYIDNEVEKIFMALRNQQMLENTVIIITSDHGEEFNDNAKGYWGHGSNYTSCQIQTPFILHWPGQSPKIWSQQTSHYDVAPFLMKKVLNCRNSESDYSIGEALLAKHKQPYLLIGSYINMAIVQQDRNMTLLASGNIRIADDHLNELQDAKVDINILEQALLAMRKFYV